MENKSDTDVMCTHFCFLLLKNATENKTASFEVLNL